MTSSSLIIAGYGVELTPRMPVNVAHLENGTLLFGTTVAEAQRTGQAPVVAVMAGSPPDGPLERRNGDLATYSCGTAGTTEIVLGHGGKDFADFFDIRLAPKRPARWTIIARDHELHWLPHFTLFSDGTVRRRSSYELSFVGGTAPGPENQLVVMYGPYEPDELPPPPALVGSGMTMVANGGIADTNVIWFELWYEHEHVPWKQLVYYVPIGGTTFIIRAQAPANRADAMFDGSDWIAQTLRAAP